MCLQAQAGITPLKGECKPPAQLVVLIRSTVQILIIVMYTLTAAFILIVNIMTRGRIISPEQHAPGIYKAVIHLRAFLP